MDGWRLFSDFYGLKRIILGYVFTPRVAMVLNVTSSNNHWETGGCYLEVKKKTQYILYLKKDPTLFVFCTKNIFSSILNLTIICISVLEHFVVYIFVCLKLSPHCTLFSCSFLYFLISYFPIWKFYPSWPVIFYFHLHLIVFFFSSTGRRENQYFDFLYVLMYINWHKQLF